jgi:hypothetical protein
LLLVKISDLYSSLQFSSLHCHYSNYKVGKNGKEGGMFIRLIEIKKKFIQFLLWDFSRPLYELFYLLNNIQIVLNLN